MSELIRDKVRVELVELGEGKVGDYNPDDPDDVELLRFDVSVFTDGEWQDVDDSSYCTQLPVSATPEQRQQALEWIMNEVYDGAASGYSIKKICEVLSWISLKALETGKITVGDWVL